MSWGGFSLFCKYKKIAFKMTIEDIKNDLPAYAYDLKNNLDNIFMEGGCPGLSPKQIAVVAVATALSTPAPKLIAVALNFAKPLLSEKELDGAKTAHAIMSMTNVYYRFLHVCDNKEYKRMPPKLEMKAETTPGISKIDFHLASIGVSSINFCKACIDYHELAARRMGINAEGIQSVVRIAAVMNAVGQILKF